MRSAHNPHVLTIALAGLLTGAVMSSTKSVVASAQNTSAPQQPNASGATISVLDGVFTAEQAARGRQIFEKQCFLCHTVAEHTGAKFAEKWSGAVGEIFDLISSTMPDGNPGGLEPAEYASILAFFLKETGYPEGKQELPATSAELMKIRIEPVPR
jgi:S-disulfanyl-L-cysteine oxidoreductase SoxD